MLALVRRGAGDPLVATMLFYMFFAFGPVINYLTGETIYFGIKTEYIPDASWIFFVGILGLMLPAWLVPLERDQFMRSSWGPSPIANILRPANAVMALVSLLLVGRLLLSGGGGADKIRSISLVGTSVHYIYLLIQVYLTAFYLNIGRSRFDRVLYFTNFLAYLTYCLVIGERDFVFIIMSLLLHWALIRPKSKSQTFKLVIGGTALAVAATAIFFLRDATQNFSSPLAALLSQGSLLFVNTYTLFLIDNGQPYFLGLSYIYACLNLLPSGVWSSGFNMPDWFREQYAPGSNSGYGFGLDIEGYLNFSWPGVFFSFVLIGFMQRKIFNAKKLRDFCLFYSVFFCAFTMYCLRNDSTAFFKGNFYAIISYLGLYFLSRFLPRLEGGRNT